jgi:hypothetical protein
VQLASSCKHGTGVQLAGPASFFRSAIIDFVGFVRTLNTRQLKLLRKIALSLERKGGGTLQ